MKQLLPITFLFFFCINIASAKNDFGVGLAFGTKSGINTDGSLKPGYGLNFRSDFFSDNILSFAPGITMFVPVESIRNYVCFLKGHGDIHINITSKNNRKLYLMGGLTFNYVTSTLMDRQSNSNVSTIGGDGINRQYGFGMKIKRFYTEIRKDCFMNQVELVVGISTL